MTKEEITETFAVMREEAKKEDRAVRSFVAGANDEANPTRERWIMNGTHVLYYDENTHFVEIREGKISIKPKRAINMQFEIKLNTDEATRQIAAQIKRLKQNKDI